MKKSFLLQTLLDLLNIQSFSKEEKPVIDYIIPIIIAMGFKVELDQLGNIYATRGKAFSYPCLNAHMDSVKGYSRSNYYSKKDAKRGNCEDCIYSDVMGVGPNNIICHMHMPPKKGVNVYSGWNCKNFTPYSDCAEEEEEAKAPVTKVVATYNEKTKVISGDGSRPIGGDDKCGIAIALSVANQTDIPMKLIFTVQEEIGCVGARHAVNANPTFFEDIAYGITIDRKENNHICVTTGGDRNASNFFIAELAKWGIISGIGIKLERGTSSDNKVFRELVGNFVNISAGYHSPHWNSETVQYDAVKRIRNWVKNFITKGEFENDEVKDV